ncbi:MAG: hypothetical protein K2X34_09380 [Hyphomonadaceae bacterium]|nr:hypothetical protein [Hyphomonadaceae bacterium]
MADASLWSVVLWAIAVVAGSGLAGAAITLVLRARSGGDYDFAAGYNAMAAHTEH